MNTPFPATTRFTLVSTLDCDRLNHVGGTLHHRPRRISTKFDQWKNRIRTTLLKSFGLLVTGMSATQLRRLFNFIGGRRRPRLTASVDRLLRATGIAFMMITVLLLAGCRPRHTVEEVSVVESGVQVGDQGIDLDGQWNAWRGPTGDGIVPPQSLLTTWSNNSNVKWQQEIPGRGHGSPIVVNSNVYVVTALDDQQSQRMLCLDRNEGTIRWSIALHEGGFPSKRELHPKSSNANGTIACDGELLFTAMLNSGSIFASAVELDGTLRWQQEVGKFESRFGYAPSPILYRSLVIIAADNWGGGYLAALDRRTGKIAWRVGRGDLSSYSSPLVANIGGRDQLVISGCGTVSSYDPSTGERLWQTPGTAESTCGTVVTDGQRVFASGGYPESQTVCLSADGDLIWSNDIKLYEPSLIVVGDKLVGVTDGGIAHCWATETGDLLWRKRLGGKFSASPIALGSTVYVPNLNGQTFVFRVGDAYESIAENQLGDDCYASPAVVQGELFLRIGVGQGAQRRERIVCLTELSGA